jgi:hypothetical protein
LQTARTPSGSRRVWIWQIEDEDSSLAKIMKRFAAAWISTLINHETPHW